jgi:DNA anti-recombination protein RmuC
MTSEPLNAVAMRIETEKKQMTSALTGVQQALSLSVGQLTHTVHQVAQQQEAIVQAQAASLQQQEAIVQAQATGFQQQEAIIRQVERLAEFQVQLAQIVERLTHTVERLDSDLLSTNAAVERLDRLMDYLMRPEN